MHIGLLLCQENSDFFGCRVFERILKESNSPPTHSLSHHAMAATDKKPLIKKILKDKFPCAPSVHSKPQPRVQLNLTANDWKFPTSPPAQVRKLHFVIQHVKSDSCGCGKHYVVKKKC